MVVKGGGGTGGFMGRYMWHWVVSDGYSSCFIQQNGNYESNGIQWIKCQDGDLPAMRRCWDIGFTPRLKERPCCRLDA